MAIAGWNMGAGDPAPHMQATREYWSKLEPFTRGFYVNDLAREVTTKDISSNYRGNLPRLKTVKKLYDPTNLFRLNANVQLS
jgi:FAD/FMN-containing dehydrogenase